MQIISVVILTSQISVPAIGWILNMGMLTMARKRENKLNVQQVFIHKVNWFAEDAF